jgi:sugar-specific transcriptional regulator TrmB
VAIDYKTTSEGVRHALVQAGLTPHQATIYEVLTQRGPQKATRLAFLAGVPRTLSYKVLEELEAEGLVVKNDAPGRASLFSPAHPIKLKELADRRLEEAKEAKTALEGALSSLIRDFDAILGVMPEKELYARVARYAGKACLEDLSLAERSSLRDAMRSLSVRLEELI